MFVPVTPPPPSPQAQLLGLGPIREGFFVSTCNRVEFILVTEPEADPEDVSARLLAFIARTGRMDSKSFQDHLYLKQDREAVRHESFYRS